MQIGLFGVSAGADWPAGRGDHCAGHPQPRCAARQAAQISGRSLPRLGMARPAVRAHARTSAVEGPGASGAWASPVVAGAAANDDYRRFVLTLAGKVAAAHKEGGQSVSPAESVSFQCSRLAPAVRASRLGRSRP